MEKLNFPLAEKDIAYLKSINYDDITKELIEEVFCTHYDKEKKKIVPPRISFQQEFILKKGEYYNTEDVRTNAGQFITNKILFGNCLSIQKMLGYVAKELNKGNINDMEDKIAKGAVNKKITPQDYVNYLDNIQWLKRNILDHFKIL